MEDENDESEVSLKTMDRKAIWLGMAALAGILGLPFVVTQCTFGYELGVDDANEIGDTLGGILGPFIGLISSILVYLALREQIKANNLIQEQFKKEKVEREERLIFEEVISDLKLSINELEILQQKSNTNFNVNQEVTLQNIIQNLFYERNIFKVSETTISDLYNTLFRIVDNVEIFLENVNNERTLQKIVFIKIKKISEFLKKTDLKILDNYHKADTNKTDLLILSSSKLLDFYYSFSKSEYQIRSIFIDSRDLDLIDLKDRVNWLSGVLVDLKTNIEFERKFQEQSKQLNTTNMSITKMPPLPHQYESVYGHKNLLVKEWKNLEENYEAFINDIAKKNTYNMHNIKSRHLELAKSNWGPGFTYVTQAENNPLN